MAWSLYVVECRDGSLYTGISSDVEKRIRRHNQGKGAKYTRSRRPVVLVGAKEIGTRSQASRAELAFKKKSRKSKIKALLCFDRRP
jgi:putative endonuclease